MGLIGVSGEKLAKAYPLVAISFNTERNPVTADDISCKSELEVWWRCPICGYEWFEKVSERVKRDYTTCNKCYEEAIQDAKIMAAMQEREIIHKMFLASNKIKPCKYEDSLEATHPEVVLDWDYEGNGYLRPSDITAKWSRKVYWKCHIDGYKFYMAVNKKVNGNHGGCKSCSARVPSKGESLAELFPELINYWDDDRLTPYEIAPLSTLNIHWKCPDCGYKYILPVAKMSSRNKDNKCPKCHGRMLSEKLRKPNVGESLADLYPKIAAEWHPTKNGELKPTDVKYGSTQLVWWKCSQGHEWQTPVHGRTQHETGFPICWENRRKKQ